MPIFVFKCPMCCVETEKLEKYTATPVHICPKCQEKLVKMNAPIAGFKIKGFNYQNGYQGNDKT